MSNARRSTPSTTELREMELPDIPPDGALLKMEVAGVCGTDVSQYKLPLRGAPLKEFRAGEDEVPVWLRFQDSDTASIEDLRDYKLRGPGGELVPLLSLVDVRMEEGASSIDRENRQTALPIRINLAEDVHDRYHSARQIKADLEGRQVTRTHLRWGRRMVTIAITCRRRAGSASW